MTTRNFFLYLFATLIQVLHFGVSHAQNIKRVDTSMNVLLIKQITDLHNTQTIKRDSNFAKFHFSRLSQNYSISSSQLGNNGLPTISNIFHDRAYTYDSEFIFNESYRYNIKKPVDVNFYNTRKPFTAVKHTSATKEIDEQTIEFIHSRNITPNLNFTFDFNLLNSAGQYPNQLAKNRYLIFNSNYITEKYSLFAAIDLNKIEVQNNGGIIDTGFVDLNSPETHLSSASTVLKNSHFFVLQEYRIGKTITEYKNDTSIETLIPTVKLSHFISGNGYQRIYIDAQSFENGYYTNFYIQKDQTKDSIFLKTLENSVSLHSEPAFVKKRKFGFDLNASGIFKSYNNFKEYIFLKNMNSFFDTKLSGSLYKPQTSRGLQYDLKAEYYFTGYRAGDHKAIAIISKELGDSTKKHLRLALRYNNSKPDYFFNTYYSNHFRWENDFDNEIHANAEISFTIPQYKFELNTKASSLQNYTFFSSVALPSQYKEPIFVYSATIKKDFHINKIHFINELSWQKSSNPDIINLPELAAYHSTTIQVDVKNALKMYVGFDIEYSTQYKPYSFMPGHGMFYYENEIYSGNYPMASVFANARIKKNVLVFIKFIHVNSNILKEVYYSVNQYPINNRMFKFGVRWTFTN
ncbi:MAG: putative porin [Bacteroidota bacterium]|nr:putative porin [Bacteroidota bacterium]